MEQELKQAPQTTQETPEPPMKNNNFWGKLAAGLAGLALLVSCIALFLVLRPGDEPGQEEILNVPAAEIPTVRYRDRELPVLENVAVNEYDADGFQVNDRGWLTYENGGKAARIGIDVSAYQEDIDWKKVADSGVEFAMIRAGYRGYSKGVVMPDKKFTQNIQGALAAGLDVGVYFFSQAVNVWEAQEEAAYVLEAVEPYDLTYPIAFDWEYIAGNSTARTNAMTADEITRCAGAFCDTVREAGYEPVIYFNQDLGYLSYRLEQLTDYEFWLAEYNARPSFYYHFDMWQYTHKATVPGILGSVDLNLDFGPFQD